MDDRERLRAQLIADEGCVLHAYQDSLGYWTIGVGHLIDPRLGGSIPATIAYALLDYDINRTVLELNEALPWISRLDPVRQAVVINMCFNMGLTRLLKFRRTLAALERGDWAAAAQGMKESLWSKQVGQRAVRLRTMVETGRWPSEQHA